MNDKKVHYLTTTEKQWGQRIDNCLITYLKGVPKTRIYRAIRKGEVRVNKRRVQATYRLEKDDVIRIPPLKTAQQPILDNPSENFSNQLKEMIIYENDDLMVMNKAAGLAVHGGTGLRGGLIERLRQILPYSFLELAHRLDRDTSGCLIIAKKALILKEIHNLMQAGGIEKKYLTLVAGKWPISKTRVNIPLRKQHKLSGERMVVFDETGQHAETLFKPLQFFNDCTLLEAQLITGRTHQIRVHCANLGHPIAGDNKYGDKTFNVLMKQRGLKRMFLHAKSLEISLASNRNTIIVSAELEASLNELLTRL